MTSRLKPYPAYRPSSLPWLREVPEQWHVGRAKWLFRKMDRPVQETDEVVTCFRDGMVTLRKNRRDRGFTESLKEIGYQGIRRGDLVIHGMDAFAGAVGVSDSEGKGTPVYSVCEPASVANAYYYSHVVREMARSEWILALARGVRERSTDFRFDDFASQPVPIPPLDEQAAIVRFIDHADRNIRRYITAKKKLIALLHEQKQAIVHRTVTRGLDPAVRFKPSGVEWLGDVPEHWEVLQLKRVLQGLIDCEHKTAPAVPVSEYRVVRTTAIRQGRLRLHGTYFTSEEAYREWTARGTPEPGDVIFTREAPAGEACVVPAGTQLCLGQRTVLLKVQRQRYDPQFLVSMIYGGPPANRIKLASQGSTVSHFNMDDIGALTVLAPPLGEQLAIVRYIEERTRSLEVVAQEAEREVALVSEYRIRLIADMVTGKVDVREAAARLPDEVDEAESLEAMNGLGEDDESDDDATLGTIDEVVA
jgi:type I restriction enzyme, S subunit